MINLCRRHGTAGVALGAAYNRKFLPSGQQQQWRVSGMGHNRRRLPEDAPWGAMRAQLPSHRI